ncbi:hypothetical protein ACQEVC_32970 [Plantactinospora sp. CA-294935]|uniref:hypothetical protein n=1 Tax=Plantactinospora sp. CA-294935 TaxID=3240012 RepID=UPI003D935705
MRSVASGLVRSLPPEELSRLGVDVTAESHEPIHGHDIAARLSAPGHELAQLLAAPGRDA